MDRVRFPVFWWSFELKKLVSQVLNSIETIDQMLNWDFKSIDINLARETIRERVNQWSLSLSTSSLYQFPLPALWLRTRWPSWHRVGKPKILKPWKRRPFTHFTNLKMLDRLVLTQMRFWKIELTFNLGQFRLSDFQILDQEFHQKNSWSSLDRFHQTVLKSFEIARLPNELIKSFGEKKLFRIDSIAFEWF